MKIRQPAGGVCARAHSRAFRLQRPLGTFEREFCVICLSAAYRLLRSMHALFFALVSVHDTHACILYTCRCLPRRRRLLRRCFRRRSERGSCDVAPVSTKPDMTRCTGRTALCTAVAGQTQTLLAAAVLVLVLCVLFIDACHRFRLALHRFCGASPAVCEGSLYCGDTVGAFSPP